MDLAKTANNAKGASSSSMSALLWFSAIKLNAFGFRSRGVPPFRKSRFQTGDIRRSPLTSVGSATATKPLADNNIWRGVATNGDGGLMKLDTFTGCEGEIISACPFGLMSDSRRKFRISRAGLEISVDPSLKTMHTLSGCQFPVSGAAKSSGSCLTAFSSSLIPRVASVGEGCNR